MMFKVVTSYDGCPDVSDPKFTGSRCDCIRYIVGNEDKYKRAFPKDVRWKAELDLVGPDGRMSSWCETEVEK